MINTQDLIDTAIDVNITTTLSQSHTYSVHHISNNRSKSLRCRYTNGCKWVAVNEPKAQKVPIGADVISLCGRWATSVITSASFAARLAFINNSPSSHAYLHADHAVFMSSAAHADD